MSIDRCGAGKEGKMFNSDLRYPKSLSSFNPIPDGCVLYLPLWARGLSGPVFKSIDSLRHVCTVTGATWGSQGRTFDGTDDVINCGSTTVLDNLGTTGDYTFTIEAWVKPISLGEGLVGQVFNMDLGFLLNVQATEAARFLVYAGGGGSSIAVSASNSVPLNAWTHIVGVYDGAHVLIYTNGTPVTGAALAGTIDAHAASNLLIGDSAASTRCFNGTIGEVRIYNRALTLQEITTTRWRYS